MILNFLNAIIVTVGENMEEKEVIVDGVKTKIVVSLDDKYIESLNKEEIEDLNKTTELDTLVEDLEKTMEIDLNG